MTARDAEIFGPLACLYSFTDEDEVLRIADENPGLVKIGGADALRTGVESGAQHLRIDEPR